MAAIQKDSTVQVEEFLEQSAGRFPEKTALVCADRRLSYRAIEAQSNRLGHGLASRGVQRGDRVAVYLDNSVEAVVSIFAILKAGAVFIVVNPTTKVDKVIHVLNDSGAKILITQSPKLASMQSCWGHTPDVETVVVVGEKAENIGSATKNFVGWDELMAEHESRVEAPPKRAIDIDIAALIYTSGSTGNPKGVVMTHLNMVAAATSVISYLENTSEDIILNVLPLSSSYGLYQVLMGFKVGATVILERSLAYPHTLVERLVEERVTGLAVVPTVAAVLLQLDLTQYRFPCLRYITNAGAALPTQYVTKLRKLFPQTRLYLMYGLTECKRVSYLAPEQVERRPNSVGKAMPNTEVYIVDENGRRLPAGHVGELVVRGSTIMKGYWKLPEETAKMLKPGPVPGERVLYTGDLFRTDEEGYLYWVGRRDEMIKCRSEKVSPTEVENVLYSLPGVDMAAVIGVPHEVLGQAIKAVITLKPGAQLAENDVLRHCARHLENFMIPTIVEFRATMPKTAAGKIDKRQMAEEKEEAPQ
ncbi:MAG TPA: AMP-binding protein [Candidatus Binatia bacterium]|jgi:acyl-CoA ligase (AMP-forming) (exosortase A-associated)